jgi:hypothetical protein
VEFDVDAGDEGFDAVAKLGGDGVQDDVGDGLEGRPAWRSMVTVTRRGRPVLGGFQGSTSSG